MLEKKRRKLQFYFKGGWGSFPDASKFWKEEWENDTYFIFFLTMNFQEEDWKIEWKLTELHVNKIKQRPSN